MQLLKNNSFYGILCSGLTDKTILSFSSSNSSFTECVRNHHIVLSNSDNNLNDPTCLIDGRQTSSPACNTSSRNTLNTGSTYDFSLCTWNSCSVSNDAGGALKCTGTGTKVYLESCYFISCSAKEKGGAIHTSSIHTLDVKQSVLYQCFTETTVDNQGSGAIWIYDIKQKLSLSQNDFISCTSKASGGASNIQLCNRSIQGENVINNCNYICCNATNQSPEGGAIWIWENEALIGLENCIFSHCSSDYGGALRHECCGYQEQSYPIRYCFFNRNTGVFGNDVGLRLYVPTSEYAALLLCFSTSDQNRIGYHVNNNWASTNVDWLPSGTAVSNILLFTSFA